MLVIADSGPLRYLILIEEVHLLPALYLGIVIPPGVVSELTRDETPTPVRTWMEHLPDWIEVRQPHHQPESLPLDLGLGEREAIALAEECRADVLLVDDGAAREEARRRHITVQGTLGVLDLAAEHGYADMASALGMLSHTNFRAGRKLLAFFLERDAARKRRSQE